MTPRLVLRPNINLKPLTVCWICDQPSNGEMLCPTCERLRKLAVYDVTGKDTTNATPSVS
jgi:hypothetical protein